MSGEAGDTNECDRGQDAHHDDCDEQLDQGEAVLPVGFVPSLHAAGSPAVSVLPLNTASPTRCLRRVKAVAGGDHRPVGLSLEPRSPADAHAEAGAGADLSVVRLSRWT